MAGMKSAISQSLRNIMGPERIKVYGGRRYSTAYHLVAVVITGFLIGMTARIVRAARMGKGRGNKAQADEQDQVTLHKGLHWFYGCWDLDSSVIAVSPLYLLWSAILANHRRIQKVENSTLRNQHTP